MTDAGIRLKVLLQERHWQTFGTFCREYDKVAVNIDPALKGTAPSRPQFHRWLSGSLTKLPHPHHCRVLEAMFPGWKAAQLFEFCDGGAATLPPPTQANVVAKDGLASPDGYADVTAIYASRSEFAANVPVEKIFDDAKVIRAAGLSLNILCQHYSDKQWRCLIEEGATLRALFLEPRGTSIKSREAEEGFDEGHLSALTDLNIQTLRRMRSRLPETMRDQVQLGTYNEIVRFNLLLVDNDLCIAQPYLPDSRGVDSPTLIMERRWPDAGLYPVFDGIFESLWDKRTPL